MPNENSKIDQNSRHTLMGVTNDANAFRQNLLVDPTTGALLCTATITGTYPSYSGTPSNGQVAIWSSATNLVGKTLTNGTGITITQDATSVTITNTVSAATLATKALDNLASVAINTALLPNAAGTIDFGSTSLPWGSFWLAGTSGTPATNRFKITGASTGGLRTITLPDASITINAASDISGTTLASNVVSSSLTSVGTISTGVWQGTTIKANYLQQAAADLGAADVNLNFGNTNGAFNTNLTIDGIFQALGIGVTGTRIATGFFTDLTVTNAIAGSVTGASTSCSGNAATATKLAATKMINAVAFDGSADIVNAFAEGTMINGRISVSVASNNLTVALKTLAGNNPSATDPVYVMIGGVVRTITAALSITMNAATNWMNLGSAELATKEADQFAFLGYNATDGVVFGTSRYPGAKIYSDFSTTNTNEKYCRISTITNAAASDPYVCIGRFAATLSAGAGYTWSVPTFTASNLIQRPIYETRPFTWVPQFSGSGAMTYLSTGITAATAQIIGNRLLFCLDANGTVGGTPDYYLYATLPFGISTNFVDSAEVINGSGDTVGLIFGFGSSSSVHFQPYNSAWTAGSGRYIRASKTYLI